VETIISFSLIKILYKAIYPNSTTDIPPAILVSVFPKLSVPLPVIAFLEILVYTYPG